MNQISENKVFQQMISLVDGYLVIHENGIWAMPHSEETVSMLKDKKCEHLYNKNKMK